MTPTQRNSPRWWALVVIHNALVHPVLPVAEVLSYGGPRCRRVADALYALHDATYPEGAG